MGGVVNVIDSRIPRGVPDETIHVDGIATYGSAANERSISGAVEAPLADKIVVHFDGSYSKTGDMETGGHILTPALRAEAALSRAPAIAPPAHLKGELPNTAAQPWAMSGRVAFRQIGSAS